MHHANNNDEPTVVEQIMSALQYLYDHCPTDDMKPIIEVSLNLCRSSTGLKLAKDGAGGDEGYMHSVRFITSLQYLKNETARNKLEEMKMVLEAACCLCELLHKNATV